jgi:hypothetical protein
MYHGFNRDDEFYEGMKNLRKPIHRRKRKWPTLDEFWADEEPKFFRLACDDQAEWRKFRRWMKKRLIESVGE